VLSFSRVAVNAHYPSDLVGGAMVGIASALLLRALLARHGLLFRQETQTLNAAR
jgi:membrane-associated phospholipid phosphatase